MENETVSPVKAKLSLLDAIKKVGEVNIDFQVVAVESTAPDKDGKTQKIVVLKLYDPIPYVRGSQKIAMEDGTLKTLELNDVDEIKVIQEDAASESFDMVIDEATGETTGTFKGSDLLLDISKNMEVWLRKTSFASAGKAMRNANQAGRLSKLRERLQGPVGIKP